MQTNKPAINIAIIESIILIGGLNEIEAENLLLSNYRVKSMESEIIFCIRTLRLYNFVVFLLSADWVDQIKLGVLMDMFHGKMSHTKLEEELAFTIMDLG